MAEAQIKKERLTDTPRELLGFIAKLDGLVKATEPEQVVLPYLKNPSQTGSLPVTSVAELSRYIEIAKISGIFSDPELNEQALKVLTEVERQLNLGTLNRFARSLTTVITATTDGPVALPYLKNPSQTASLFVADVTGLSRYIEVAKINGIFSDPELNEQALALLSKTAVLLEIQSNLEPNLIEFAKNIFDIERLEDSFDVRSRADIDKRTQLIEFAKRKRRLAIESAAKNGANSIPIATVEQFRVILQPLETTDEDDRALLIQLREEYGLQLAIDFKRKAIILASSYLPGLRRTLIREAQQIVGTGFVGNGNEEKLGEALAFVVRQQRDYFQTRVSQFAFNEDFNAQKINELLEIFEVFDADDLSFENQLEAKAFQKLRVANKYRFPLLFRQKPAEFIISNLVNLPEESAEDIQLKVDLLEEYKAFLRIRKDVLIEDYNYVFEKEIQLIRSGGAKTYEIRDVGFNYEGAKISRENYRKRLQPLLQVLEGDKESLLIISKTLSEESRRKYVLNLERLREQRDLTPIEEAWFRSAELTSFIIPYLVGLVNADRQIVLQHLEYLFNKISRETQERLNQLQYFPAIVVGIGPNGMAGLGEIRRISPELLDGTLVIDQARNPGGPFAVPESAAFNLNSQAPRLATSPILPDKPNYSEEISIQGYVSPLQALPGQRTEEEKVIRGLSINSTDPSLISDKDVASEIYPTNEDLEIVVNLQAALTVQHLSLSTRLLKVENNTTRFPGSKLLTLEITEANGKKRIQQVTTDLLINATGLGEPNYGFDIKGKKAEKVIAASQNQEESVPLVSTTLDTFRGLGGRFEKQPGSGVGEVIGIAGNGNSFDTIAERIVGKFVPARAAEQAKAIRERIGKIFVISSGSPRNAREYLLSQRSRYAALADFIDRGDRKDNNERLITFINDRVTDFDFFNEEASVATNKRQVIIYGQDNQIIKDQYGKNIVLDNLILTTGFRSAQSEVYDEYSRQNGQNQFEKSPLTLSSAPQIQVGEQLPFDSDTIFIGTGSVFATNPTLKRKKLLEIAQVSPEAADALLRVGGNLVAVGVKARDSVAALNDFIYGRRESILRLLDLYRTQELDQSVPAAKVVLDISESAEHARLSNQLSPKQKELFASSVIATELQGMIFEGETGVPLNQDFVFEISATPSAPPERTTIYSLSKTYQQQIAKVRMLFTGQDQLNQKQSAASKDQFRPLSIQVVGVYENQQVPKDLNDISRITNATFIERGAAITNSPLPKGIQEVLDTPHFVKTVQNILPFSDTGKYRLQICIRKGKVMPQRTILRAVSGL